MEWQQLLGFYQVARLGSFTRAGEATLRSQSALSQQIKALEEELAAPLFERLGRRKLLLTPAGEALLAFARTVFRSYDQLLEEVALLKDAHRGRLRLAAPFTTLYHLFPAALQEYVRRYPQVQLTILDRPQPQVPELVRNGDADLGVALASLAPRDLAARRWLPVHTVIMVPTDHPLTRARRVTLRDIARYPLILPPPGSRSGPRHLLEQRLKQLGRPYHVVLESSNVELSARYVEMGLGVSFATVVREPPPGLAGRRLAFLPLPRPFRPDHLALVFRPGKVWPPHQQAFVDLLFTSPTAAAGPPGEPPPRPAPGRP